MTDILIPQTAGKPFPFTPPSLEHRELKPVFWIRTPSAYERDQLGASLFNMGLRSPTQEIIRATLIDDLYVLYGDDKGDEMAGELEGFWQSDKADKRAVGEWEEQEVQRQLDISNGAPYRAPAQPPIPVTHRRLAARMRILVDDLQHASQRLRNLQIQQMNYALNQSKMLVRLGVDRIEGLEELNGGKAWSPSSAPASAEDGEMLRDILADDAWEELTKRIDDTYRLTEAERKNFGSPPANGSDRNGLPEQSGESAPSDGSSTASSISPAPIEGSGSTIAAS